jgi:hypothetical protein
MPIASMHIETHKNKKKRYSFGAANPRCSSFTILPLPSCRISIVSISQQWISVSISKQRISISITTVDICIHPNGGYPYPSPQWISVSIPTEDIHIHPHRGYPYPSPNSGYQHPSPQRISSSIPKQWISASIPTVVTPDTPTGRRCENTALQTHSPVASIRPPSGPPTGPR